VFDCTADTAIDIPGRLTITAGAGISCEGSDGGPGFRGSPGFDVTLNVGGDLIVQGFISAVGGTGGSGSTGANGAVGGEGGDGDIDVCGHMVVEATSLISARGAIGGGGGPGSGSSRGGNGNVGGSGGTISIDVDGSFVESSDGAIDASGGGGGTGGAGGFDGNGGNGANAGSGGTINISSCTTDIAGGVASGGGTGGSGGPGGGNGDGGANGNGGNGGTLTLASGTDLLLQSSAILSLIGGNEGQVGSGNPPGADVGIGGNGGSITANHCSRFLDSGAALLLQGGQLGGMAGSLTPLDTVTCCSCDSPLDCDDRDPCTDDRCEESTCVRVALSDTSPCDDGDGCTVGDVCTDRVCRGDRVCVGFGPVADQPAVRGTRFGDAVALAGQRLMIGAPSDFDREGAVYVLDIDGSGSAALRYRLNNPLPALSRDFGSAVTFAAGNSLAVGALGDRGPTGERNPGAVHVFSGASGTLRFTLFPPEPPTEEDETFGSAMAAVGASILVGDSRCNVYLFDAASGVRREMRDPDENSLGCGSFGAAVADAGEGAILVGDPSDRRAYLIRASDGGRLQTFAPSSGNQLDEFGAAVAALGKQVLIGAPGDDVAYLFDRDTGAVVRVLTNPAAPPLSGGRFGATVAVTNTGLLVGAPGNEARPPSTRLGAVYLINAQNGEVIQSVAHPEPQRLSPPLREFGAAITVDPSDGSRVLVGSPGTVGGTAYLFAFEQAALVFGLEGPGVGSFFGASVVALEEEILVGAPGADLRGIAAGSVYRVSAQSGDIIGSFQSPRPTERQRFGTSVAAGPQLVIIGAPGDDAAADDAGAVFAKNYDGTDEYIAISPDPRAGDGFGTAVALVGPALVVGAPFADVTAPDAGAAFVFDAATGAFSRRLAKPAPLSSVGAFFGSSLAALGEDVLIGSPFDENGAGAVLLFDLATGELLRTLHNPDPSPGDLFGASISVVAGNILVGAPLADVNGSSGAVSDAGAAYLFDGVTGDLLCELQSPEPAPSDEFGFAVAALGEDLVVGAPLEEPSGASIIDTGGAFVFVFDGTSCNLRDVRPNPLGATRDQAGFSLAIFGTDVLMGAPRGGGLYLARAQGPGATSESRAGVTAESPVACSDFVAGTRVRPYCDDDDPCTDDVCQSGGCVHNPVAGCRPLGCRLDAQCDDGLMCNGFELCQLCTGCFLNSDLPCCDQSAKCSPGVVLPRGTPCPNGNACDGTETCSDGVCLPGRSLECIPRRACEVPGCNPATGCTFTPMGCPCVNDQECDDLNPCTEDACDIEGCSNPPATGASCDDGNSCNGAESCREGQCVRGSAPICTKASSIDECFEAARCALPVPGCVDGEMPERVKESLAQAQQFIDQARGEAGRAARIRPVRRALEELSVASRALRRLQKKRPLPPECYDVLKADVAQSRDEARQLLRVLQKTPK
jgi:hypothetical protein